MFRLKRPMHDVELKSVAPLTSTLVRLTLTGPTLSTFAIEFPTQWAKLAIPGGHSRAYTLRRHRPDRGELDLDVVLHGNGPLSRWAATARPGAPAKLSAPRGHRPSFDGAARILLAADESGIPAALTILEQLPPGTPVVAHFEIATAADTLHLATRADVTPVWLPREGAFAKGELLARSVSTVELPPGSAAWLAAEATAVDTARRHLLTTGAVSRDRLHAKGYWRRGKAS
ncbi:siderophore-interacting protein [Kitasatospora sp. NPDC097643]|uniref:siderophore-interacting protein n=1 Tax=Kitasatospora sp. NPDC097643 TaxID=3157230 RepID=UPI00332D9E87